MKSLVGPLLSFALICQICGAETQVGQIGNPPREQPEAEAAPTDSAETPKDTQPSPTPSAQPNVVPMNKRGKLRVSVYGFINSADEMTFDDLKVTNGTDSFSGSAKFKAEPAYGLGAEIGQGEPHNWGWALGLSYESKREISSQTITLDGDIATANYSGKRPSISFLILYANAIYRSEKYYFPFGLNACLPKFEQGAGATGTMKVDGSLGAQGGVGLQINEHFSLEAMLKVLTLTIKAENANVKSDYGAGNMAGTQLNLKLDF